MIKRPHWLVERPDNLQRQKKTLRVCSEKILQQHTETVAWAVEDSIEAHVMADRARAKQVEGLKEEINTLSMAFASSLVATVLFAGVLMSNGLFIMTDIYAILLGVVRLGIIVSAIYAVKHISALLAGLIFGYRDKNDYFLVRWHLADIRRNGETFGPHAAFKFFRRYFRGLRSSLPRDPGTWPRD